MGFNVNEVYQGSSDHLKSEDIGNDFITYTMASVDQKKFDNGDVKLILSFQETDKTLVLNATNARTIGDMYTPDTDAWFGRQILLFTMPVEFNGQKTMGIRVRAPQQQNNQNQAQQQHNSGNNPPPPNGPNDYGNQSQGR